MQCRRHRLNPWAGKMSWRRKWQRVPIFLPGEAHGQRNLEGYSPQGHKESDMTEWLSTHRNTLRNWDPLFKGLTCSHTYSEIQWENSLKASRLYVGLPWWLRRKSVEGNSSKSICWGSRDSWNSPGRGVLADTIISLSTCSTSRAKWAQR